MRSPLSNLAPLFLVTALASPLAITGCQSQPQMQSQPQPQAQPQSQPSSYVQWEHETHRPHVDLNRRSAEEQRQYQDWLRSHNGRH
ncbi:MAG TPA: hypothetical protein VMA34_17915 [Terracidiphilus sp.]|nr:hypothetical protein [Terracidiphilus sp.]